MRFGIVILAAYTLLIIWAYAAHNPIPAMLAAGVALIGALWACNGLISHLRGGKKE